MNHSKKKDTNIVEEIVDQVILNPRKAQILQVYSRCHWKKHILLIYRAQLALLCLKYLTQNKPLPHSNICLKIKVTQEQWAAETPEFQEVVRQATEAMYEQLMKEYDEVFKNIPKSGKEYDWSVSASLQCKSEFYLTFS